jgi:hypothetical protein
MTPILRLFIIMSSQHTASSALQQPQPQPLVKMALIVCWSVGSFRVAFVATDELFCALLALPRSLTPNGRYVTSP